MYMLKLKGLTVPHEEIRQEIAGSPLWGQIKLRTTHEGTPHGQVTDLLLRFNRMQQTREQALDDCETYPLKGWTDFFLCRQVALDLMRHVEGTRLGRVMLTHLPPGGRITPHVDAGTPATYYHRYHCVIACGPGPNKFRTEADWVDMRPGEVWWVNNAREHEVVNESGSERVHLIVDIKEDHELDLLDPAQFDLTKKAM